MGHGQDVCGMYGGHMQAEIVALRLIPITRGLGVGLLVCWAPDMGSITMLLHPIFLGSQLEKSGLVDSCKLGTILKLTTCQSL
jgi:hypothetical protein